MSYLAFMVVLHRMRVEWSGSAVTGPGVTTFYFGAAATGTAASVKTFFTALAPTFPTGVTWTVPESGDAINDTNGSLAGTWSEAGGGGQVSGSVAGNFARGVGAQIRWTTGGIRHGRRVIGSTFLVPLAVGAYDVDGSLQASTVTLLNSASANLLAAQPLTILSRATPGTSDGISSAVAGRTVPDRVSWLRSRKT